MVDDEKLIRRGIINHIKNSHADLEVAGEAENGRHALEYCRQCHPEIVITDVLMPEMDGIQFINELKKCDSGVRVVIISGYDEFAYAQSAMRLEVADYLLKPFLPEELERTLIKVKESIDRQKNFYNNIKKLQIRLEESLPIVRERFYIDLAAGHLTPEDIRYKSEFLNVDLTADYYCVAIIKACSREATSPSDISREELIRFFLTDIVDQLLGPDIKAFVFGISDNQLGVIICGRHKHKHHFFHSMNEGLSKLTENMGDYCNVLLYASLGKIYEDILKLPLSYSEAREAIAYSFAGEDSTVIHFEEVFLSGSKPYEKPTQLLSELILYIKIGYRKEAFGKLEEVFEYYRQNCMMRPDFIKTDMVELVLAMHRYIEEAKGDNYFLYRQNLSPYEQIQKTESLNELQALLVRFIGLTIQEILQIKAGQSSSIIEKLKSVTASNLENEAFNLDYAASKLYISPNYLRQLFKQETGETFGEYLTGERMKKAAALIADPSIKISEISERVGYGSQSYFSKCFRKYYGSTPSEYREEMFGSRQAEKTGG